MLLPRSTNVRPLAADASHPLPAGASRSAAILLAAAWFVVIAAWSWVFRYTADGDAILHYFNARDCLSDLRNALYAWSRPLFKALLMPVVMLGPYAARLVVAAASALLVYHTVRLAQQLRLARPIAAGWLLVLQPFFLALGGDIMSEVPMALGLVLTLRLWLSGNINAACVVGGFLPLLRPEGYLTGPIWGLMVLVSAARILRSGGSAELPRVARMIALRGLLLSLGLLTWTVLCALLMGDALLWKNSFWPVGSYAAYPSGSILHHVDRWPDFTGPILLPLFLVGLSSLAWRRMRVVWAIWGVVFVAHSILFWGHWFASFGLMRIFVCTSPFTALICLAGWNVVADCMESIGRSLLRPWLLRSVARAVATAGIAVGSWVVLLAYLSDRAHWYTFAARDAAAFVRRQGLTQPGRVPYWFVGNRILEADLNLPSGADHVMPTHFDADRAWRTLREMPIGSIGIWDDEQAPQWHRVSIDDLRAAGFTELYRTSTDLMPQARYFLRGQWKVRSEVVVFRKDRPVEAELGSSGGEG